MTNKTAILKKQTGRVIALCLLLLLKNIYLFSQSEIDEANISILKINLPNFQYKENKTKEVKTYFEDSSRNAILVEYAIYDKEGLLVYKEIFNNASPSDKEIIRVEKDKDVFKVARTIAKRSLLNAELCIECFWALWYYPLREYWEAVDSNTIEIESVYNPLNDSYLSYSTFIYGKKIDSGTLMYKFLDGEDLAGLKVDTMIQGDTLIEFRKSAVNEDVNILTKKVYLKNFIIKSEERHYEKDSLFSTMSVLYKYDQNKRLYLEEYYNNDGKIGKRRSFSYLKGSRKFTFADEFFSPDGRLNNVSKYNINGLIEEELTYGAIGKVVRKTLYQYLPNGLLREKRYSDGAKMKSRHFYLYKSF